MKSIERSYNHQLSICIPTYNRCEKLKETILLMINKVKEYRICFFISDNASTDDTEKVVNELFAHYDYIVYSKNDENLGFDRNLEIVLKMSNTKYKWTFGDDDYLDNVNIQEIMESINQGYDLIVLSRENGSENQKYTDMRKLMVELGPSMTWISTLILSEKIVNCSQFERFYDTSFLHIGIIFTYLANNDSSVLYLSRVVIRQSLIKTNDYSKRAFTIFIIDLHTTIFRLPEFYNMDQKRSMLRLHTKNYCNYSLLPIQSRINNELDLDFLIKNWLQFKTSFSFRWRIYTLIVSFLPKQILSKTRCILRFIKSTKNNFFKFL